MQLRFVIRNKEDLEKFNNSYLSDVISILHDIEVFLSDYFLRFSFSLDLNDKTQKLSLSGRLGLREHGFTIFSDSNVYRDLLWEIPGIDEYFPIKTFTDGTYTHKQRIAAGVSVEEIIDNIKNVVNLVYRHEQLLVFS